MLRDQVVLGVASDLVREKLLYENSLPLAVACAIVADEETHEHQDYVRLNLPFSYKRPVYDQIASLWVFFVPAESNIYSFGVY